MTCNHNLQKIRNNDAIALDQLPVVISMKIFIMYLSTAIKDIRGQKYGAKYSLIKRVISKRKKIFAKS